jgi:hypothetical protein
VTHAWFRVDGDIGVAKCMELVDSLQHEGLVDEEPDWKADGELLIFPQRPVVLSKVTEAGEAESDGRRVVPQRVVYHVA